MLYRSWPNMMHYACRPLDDWWDTSYDNLSRHPLGWPRDSISLNKELSESDSDDAADLADLILGRFLGDFERTLSGEQGIDASKAAAGMIASSQWISVPDEPAFMMGTPAGAPQGCPTQKADTYWKQALLDPIQTHRDGATPRNIAEIGTWKEWFAPGGVGRKGWEFDVAWLKDLLQPLWDEKPAKPPTCANRESPIYIGALREIQKRFKTQDEDAGGVPAKSARLRNAPLAGSASLVLALRAWSPARRHRLFKRPRPSDGQINRGLSPTRQTSPSPA